MSPAIVAAATSGEVPKRPIPVLNSERVGLAEVFESWGRDPHELDWSEEQATSLADLAASVLPGLTRNRSLSTLILATATHDAKPTSQPSVAVLREHIVHDHAIDLPAAWSITEQGMLATLTALRVGCRRVRRLTGDVVIIAADRVGLPYPVQASRCQEVENSCAVGAVLGDSDDSVWFGTGRYEDFARLLDQALAATEQPDYVVVGGDPDPVWEKRLAAIDRPVLQVEPGQPVVSVFAEAVQRKGRVLLVIADPDLGLIGLGSLYVRTNS